MDRPPVTDDHPPLPAEIEQRLLAVLDGPARKWSSEFEKICAEHPQHALAVRAWLDQMQRGSMSSGKQRTDKQRTELWGRDPKRQSSGGKVRQVGHTDGWPRPFGRYSLLKQLGRGGMGVVYLARDEDLGRTVALKALPSRVAATDQALERFTREAKAVARLSHEQIVRIFEVGEEEGTPYFTMEFVEGCTLAQLITAARDLNVPSEQLSPGHLARSVAKLANAKEGGGTARPWGTSFIEAACRMILDVADALEHAHQNGVLHRDVKPSNVLVTVDGRARLFDFGLARLETDQSLTMTGDFVGTPYYVSPEQISARRIGIDKRTDVYSLGVTLYELLSLHVPFPGETTHEVFKQIQFKEPAPLRRVNPQVPRDVETVCLAAMEKDPDRRYQSAGELAADLRRFLEFRPVQARPAGVVTRGMRFVRRHRVTAVIAALLFLIVVVGPLVFAWVTHRDQKKIEGERNEKQLALEQKSKALDAQQKALEAQQKAVNDLQQALKTSEGIRLLAQSRIECLRNKELALLLAIEGAERTTGKMANSALIEALTQFGEIRTLRHGDRAINSVVCDPGTADRSITRIVTAGNDGRAVLWDARYGAQRGELGKRGDPGIEHVELGVGGQWLLTRSLSAREAALRSVATGEVLREFRLASGAILICAAFTPDGTAVAIGGADGTVRLLRTDDASELATFLGHEDAVLSVEVSPDGSRLLTASKDKTARLWETGTGKPGPVLSGHWARLVAACFSPKADKVLTCSEDATARIWSVTDGAELVRISGHAASVLSARFSPDGERVVTASADKTARITGAQTGTQLALLDGHTERVNLATFSPDGRLVATVSADRTCRVWNAADATQRESLFELEGHTQDVRCAVFSADSHFLITASVDGTARLWPMDPLVVARDVRSSNELALSFEQKKRFDLPLSEAEQRGKEEADRMTEVQQNNFLKGRVTELGLSSTSPWVKAAQDYLKLRGVRGASALANDAWLVVRVPGATGERLADALRRADEAFQSNRSHGFYCTVLAAARYRNGEFQKAIELLTALTRMSQLSQQSQKYDHTPPDLAILAMASHRLERPAAAREYLGQLRVMAAGTAYQSNREIRELQKEAEQLIEAPPAERQVPGNGDR